MELIMKTSCFSILAPEAMLHEQIEMEMKGIVTLNVRFK